MSFQIQMIGTGNASAKKYYNTNALLFCRDFKLLIDCGFTASKSLHELGLGIDQIDGILITHIHADHVGGLEEAAFRLYYKYRKRIKLFVPALLAQKLWENTLRGGLENAGEKLTSLTDFFDLILLEDGVKSILHDGLSIELIETLHIPTKASYSLFINDSVFYSADIQFNPDLLINEVLGNRQCSYILHDCQLKGPAIVHATLEQILTLPTEIHSKIYLMHYEDEMENYIGRVGQMTFMRQHEVYSFDT
jgi:hydroxyacylglutathione hydrolase